MPWAVYHIRCHFWAGWDIVDDFVEVDTWLVFAAETTPNFSVLYAQLFQDTDDITSDHCDWLRACSSNAEKAFEVDWLHVFSTCRCTGYFPTPCGIAFPVSSFRCICCICFLGFLSSCPPSLNTLASSVAKRFRPESCSASAKATFLLHTPRLCFSCTRSTNTRIRSIRSTCEWRVN